MSYEVALNKAWDDLRGLTKENNHSVKFLADEYTIDLEAKKVLSLSCNIVPHEHIVILILHYLKKSLSGLPELTAEWMTFKEIPESIGYYPAYHARVIGPLLRKYGQNPDAVLERIENLPAKKIQQADVGIVIELFPEVPMMVEFWKGDSEFWPEANVLFDKSILKIFCTEDIVVLAEFLAHSL